MRVVIRLFSALPPAIAAIAPTLSKPAYDSVVSLLDKRPARARISGAKPAGFIPAPLDGEQL